MTIEAILIILLLADIFLIFKGRSMILKLVKKLKEKF